MRAERGYLFMLPSIIAPRSDADAAQERRPGAADDREARDAHVAAERVGDQVDAVAEFAERLDAVVLAEGGPARLEERLGTSIRTRAEAVAFGTVPRPLVEAGQNRGGIAK